MDDGRNWAISPDLTTNDKEQNKTVKRVADNW
jgi:hypothetical protein